MVRSSPSKDSQGAFPNPKNPPNRKNELSGNRLARLMFRTFIFKIGLNK